MKYSPVEWYSPIFKSSSRFCYFKHGCSFHKATLCNLNGLMRRTTSTVGLKVHIQEAKYNLCRASYSCVKNGSASLCSDPRKVNQLPVLLVKLGSKQKVLDQIIHLLNALEKQKVLNKDSSMQYKPHITELRQMGQNSGQYK